MDRTTLSRAMQPLARDGLLRVVPSESDGRSKEVHLAKAGAQRLRAGHAAWASAQARFEAEFGKGRAAELRALLRSVVER
jgi:DNA-binding MarR family transcriptional regulator